MSIQPVALLRPELSLNLKKTTRYAVWAPGATVRVRANDRYRGTSPSTMIDADALASFQGRLRQRKGASHRPPSAAPTQDDDSLLLALVRMHASCSIGSESLRTQLNQSPSERPKLYVCLSRDAAAAARPSMISAPLVQFVLEVQMGVFYRINCPSLV